jgi:colanic acid/amylovoran biosynthesis glycosyltransferase
MESASQGWQVIPDMAFPQAMHLDSNPWSPATEDGCLIRIAYLAPCYPFPSLSFIRREIAALEAWGARIERYSLRRWNQRHVDVLDANEQLRTQVVLEIGPPKLLWEVFRTAMTRPARFLKALRLACWFAGRSDRGLFRHLCYLVEACNLLAWCKRDAIKHIHVHFGTHATITALLCNALGGPPYSFTAHGPEEFDKPIAIGLDEKIRLASFVVVISEYGRSQLYRYAEYSEWPKINIVRCGVDMMFLGATITPPPANRRLVCVGRLVEQKGHLILIEAMWRLQSEGIDFELIIVGDGPLRPEIERLIRRLDLGHRVSLVGWQSNASVRERILDARAMVVPSFAEGLPVVLMEAMALGRPVISTYVAGIPELVQPDITGWLVPPGSVQELTAAIKDCLDAPPERLAQMGRAGFRKVAENHKVEAEAKKLAGLFRRAVERGNTPTPPGSATQRRLPN